MEKQYFTFDDVQYIQGPDDFVPGGATMREHLGLTDEQYAAALAEWQATGEQA